MKILTSGIYEALSRLFSINYKIHTKPRNIKRIKTNNPFNLNKNFVITINYYKKIHWDKDKSSIKFHSNIFNYPDFQKYTLSFINKQKNIPQLRKLTIKFKNIIILPKNWIHVSERIPYYYKVKDKNFLYVENTSIKGSKMIHYQVIKIYSLKENKKLQVSIKKIFNNKLEFTLIKKKYNQIMREKKLPLISNFK